MSAERPVEPEVRQALEEAQEALRREQLALEDLPYKKDRLQEQLRRLQAERDAIHQ